jgi:hypothetical protein
MGWWNDPVSWLAHRRYDQSPVILNSGSFCMIAPESCRSAFHHFEPFRPAAPRGSCPISDWQLSGVEAAIPKPPTCEHSPKKGILLV